MDKRPRETLDDLLEMMPRNVAPPRALWPGIAREIARPADAVHELPPHYVGAVDVAENIHLDGGVDGDDA